MFFSLLFIDRFEGFLLFNLVRRPHRGDLRFHCLALALELYGTWLGNWTWSPQVPGIPLVTTNPPGIASAFYAVLDALVACTALVLGARVSLANPSRVNRESQMGKA